MVISNFVKKYGSYFCPSLIWPFGQMFEYFGLGIIYHILQIKQDSIYFLSKLFPSGKEEK